jgi:erythritol/L-threitol dehydrogenase
MVLAAHGIIHKLPKGLSAQHAVYVEPLSCSAHGAEIAGIMLGDTVVASGCGPIGLGFIAAAKMRSPQRLIALDVIDSRLELARKCGADVCINVAKEDAVARVREVSDAGQGADVYFEASGSTDSVTQGLRACRKAATFVSFSVFQQPATVDWTIIGDTKVLAAGAAPCPHVARQCAVD